MFGSCRRVATTDFRPQLTVGFSRQAIRSSLEALIQDKYDTMEDAIKQGIVIARQLHSDHSPTKPPPTPVLAPS